jgi:glycosyltransferase involved in cell wall biosynthesis
LRLLVASHDASRTGAPILLLTFLRWVRRTTDADVQLVLWRGGPLEAAFAEVATMTVLHPPPGRRSAAETMELGLGELGLHGLGAALTSARVRRALDVGDHDAVLLNGAGSALVVPHLRTRAPSLAWVHELDRGLRFSLVEPGRGTFLAADRFVAVAQCVADELTGSWDVPRERVAVRHGCLPERLPGPSGTVSPPVDAGPLVGAVGAGSWRKGIDLFARVAADVRRRHPDVRFAWVGPLDDEAELRRQLTALGLSDVVDLPGEVGDPDPWYAAMDVFVSTAREDPFPLVGLEAGAAGVPIVAFDSGGLTELLAGGRGTVVGPQDVAAMVDQVSAVLRDPTDARAAAARLQAHVMAHHRVERLGAALWADLAALR